MKKEILLQVTKIVQGFINRVKRSPGGDGMLTCEKEDYIELGDRSIIINCSIHYYNELEYCNEVIVGGYALESVYDDVEIIDVELSVNEYDEESETETPIDDKDYEAIKNALKY